MAYDFWKVVLFQIGGCCFAVLPSFLKIWHVHCRRRRSVTTASAAVCCCAAPVVLLWCWCGGFDGAGAAAIAFA